MAARLPVSQKEGNYLSTLATVNFSGSSLFFKQFLLIHFFFPCLLVKTLVRLAHSHVKTATHKFARISVKLLASSRLQLNVLVSTELLRAGQLNCHSSPADHTLILMAAICLVLQTQDTVTSSNSLL